MKLPYDFGKYELQRELGKGAFAKVYLAWHKGLKAHQVLKILRPEIREDPVLLERFRTEAQTMAAMRHENIIRVTDMDEFAGELYIAMEYVEGEDLEKWLGRPSPLPIEITLLIMLDICRGLAAAHTRTIHRDIKPANMILTRDGVVKLMDFGLARRIEDVGTGVTQFGQVMGTPAYMSPEQDLGEPLDRRTDIFSAGVVGYRMLTGDRPFPGKTVSEIRESLRTREPRPLVEFNASVPREVARMIHHMLEKSLERRCQNIEEAANVFERALNRAGVKRDLLRAYVHDPDEVTRRLKASPLVVATAEEDPVADPNRTVVLPEGVDAPEGVAPKTSQAFDVHRTRALLWATVGLLGLIVIAGAVFGIPRLLRRDAEPSAEQPSHLPNAGLTTDAQGKAAPPPLLTQSSPSESTTSDPIAHAVPAPTAKAVHPEPLPARPQTTPPATTTPLAPANPPAPAPATDRPGTLVIDLKPDVPVYLGDDRVTINGYKRLSLTPGTYVVRAKYQDFEFHREVRIEADKTVTVQYDLIMASTGSVRVALTSTEGWGYVVVDDVKRHEQAPGLVEGLAPGKHKIGVDGPQYSMDGPPVVVDIVAGSTVELLISLKPKRGEGK